MERVYFTLQELKQRPSRHTSLFVILAHPTFLYNSGPPYPGVALPRLSCTLPHQCLNKKMHYRLAYRQSDVGLFSTDASLPRYLWVVSSGQKADQDKENFAVTRLEAETTSHFLYSLSGQISASHL